jgi:hypothetical protein
MMSRQRWPVLFLIAVALTLFVALQRPATTSAQEVATPTSTPEFTATPLPLETATSEPTVEPTPEPTLTPTPIPPVLVWDAVPGRVEMAAGGLVTVPLRLRVEQADVAQLKFTAANDLDGFTAQVAPDMVQDWPAGSSRNLVLTVKADPHLAVGNKPIVLVTADDGQGQSAQVAVSLKVAWPQVITVNFDPQDQPADPGRSAYTKATVTNRDTIPHTIQPRAYMDLQAPFTYKIPNLPDSLTLQPGEENQFTFGLKPNLGVPAGARGKVVFEAHRVQGQTVESELIASDQAFAQLAERFRVAVSAVPASQQPPWSERATYTLLVTNTGSLEGRVDWDVSNGPEHFTAIAEKPETLPYLKPGEATQVKLEVDPVFAGWFDFFNTVSARFHTMTDGDKQQFSAFVALQDVTTTTIKLGDATAQVEVTTLRPERPRIELPPTVKAESAQAPAGHGPHSPNGLTCGLCHTTHGSPQSDTPDQKSQLLLASTTRALCDTCHDGTGSIYNVEAGLINGGYPSNAGPLKHPSEPGPITTGYLFGTRNYFANQAMVSVVPLNPKRFDVVVKANPAVSAHALEKQHAAPPGGDGLEGTLTCTSCHDPHGITNTARLVSIQFAGMRIPVAFEATYSKSPEEHVNLISGSVDVCRACHTTIDNHGGGGPQQLDSTPELGKPWDIFQTRAAGWLPLESEGQTPNQHMVCLTCHAAHGSRTSLPGHFEKLMRDPFIGIEDKYGSWCAACHDL